MELTGLNFVGEELSGAGKATFRAVNPASNAELSPAFFEATPQEIDNAIAKAEDAFPTFSGKSGKDRALFLERMADEILVLGNGLITRCSEETGLPETRIAGERARTMNQLRLFAALLKEGSWVEARIDTAEPQRLPVPKPDIRSMRRALGPVVIFGAANFPLAFSVAGGDTTSALAAGCSVVFKAHPAHPGTCEMVASAILRAIERSGMPDGSFSMLHGRSTSVGLAMVSHPSIRAIGFTGSSRGGKEIFDTAMRRPEPVPVYAEMGSTNPVFILPGALREKKDDIAKGLTVSVTLGAGQFCTNPGLVFLEESDDARQFQKVAAAQFRAVVSAPMLTRAIHQSFQQGIEKLTKQLGIHVLARGKSERDGLHGNAVLLKTDVGVFLEDTHLEEEVFGPSTLAVTAKSRTELLQAARHLKGHLTATVWATDDDLRVYSDLVAILERKVGRVIINGFPTGVEVCHAMVHGGPFPATTDCRSTSVGTLAINRFTRPVCYQNFPETILPEELQSPNPLGIWRMVDGEWNNAGIEAGKSAGTRKSEP
jgi:2,5-dioxopentanoate dehydrogenase